MNSCKAIHVRLTDDDAGCGGGGANPDFVARLEAGDTSDEAPTSPRNVFRSPYVANGYACEHEDLWVESMLTTSTAPGNYPGNSSATENWPGFSPHLERPTEFVEDMVRHVTA